MSGPASPSELTVVVRCLLSSPPKLLEGLQLLSFIWALAFAGPSVWKVFPTQQTPNYLHNPVQGPLLSSPLFQAFSVLGTTCPLTAGLAFEAEELSLLSSTEALPSWPSDRPPCPKAV